MSSVHGKVTHHEPCSACGSKDNVARYEDGYAKCFGKDCGWYQMPGDESMMTTDEPIGGPPLLNGLEYTAIPSRGLTAATCEQWKYGIAVDEAGRKCQVANEYSADGRLVSQKLRYPGKEFRRRGDKTQAQLFGQRACASHRQIIITEGEIDCLAAAQAHGLKWPVVSVPDGAHSALAALEAQAEWLDTHESIVLLFDDDEPGQTAAREVAEQLLVQPGKIKIGTVAGFKDAGEALAAGQPKRILEAVWNAKEHRPGGVVAMSDLWDEVNTEPEEGIAYPWQAFTEFTHGQRPRELVTWCAGSGVGKSAFVKEIAYQLAVDSGDRVGFVALEESVRRTTLDMMSLDLNRRLAIPEVYRNTPEALRKESFERVSKNFLLYNHWGSLDDGSLMAKLRYMAGSGGCTWLVLDHISIVISAQADEGDERKRLDRMMTNLRSFVEQTGVGLHLVSHLRRQNRSPHEEGGQVHLGDLRGSQAIAQLSDWVVGVERNQQEPDLFDRNMCTLRVLKNRPFGDTGEACQVWYDRATGRLIEGDTARAKWLLEADTNE
jgi:twinkle protein